MVVWNAFGAELHPGVHACANELELQAKDEIRVGTGGAEEFVARNLLLERTGAKRAVLNTPCLVRIPFPAGKCLAVKDQLRLGSTREQTGRHEDRENDLRFHGGDLGK